MQRGRLIIGAVIAVVAILAGVLLYNAQAGYQLKLVLPSAAQLPVGGEVLIHGEKVGSIDDLAVQDGKAVATISIGGRDVPLHEGTTSRIEWFSALGERFIELYPGPTKNAAIPSGSIYRADAKQIEVDQVLSALDKPTRDHLSSLFGQLNGVVQGREPDLNQTLKTAGPAVQAVGEVLQGVGKDGPAIRSLVSELHQLVGVAAERQNQLRSTISDLTAFTGTAATQQRQLSLGLAELPSTLREARLTLDRVHPAVQATVPLLNDLRPATDRLPSVARNLAPVLHDLRPALKDLVPTVYYLKDVLRHDELPDTLDTAQDDLPKVTELARKARPTAAFMRPYTPEFIGFITNWGMAFATYDSQGHFWNALVAEGQNGNGEMEARTPGEVMRAEPKPGEAVGQPWYGAVHETVDAAGGGEH